MLKNVFQHKTVDSVLEAFNKTLYDLTQINNRANEQAAIFSEQALDFAAKADLARAEAARATSVYNKISNLIA